ncbi:unnamed protein product [Paramecium primaurelia]|uniref:Uncharacterized protein n=1 Tax=Paramecium primaurelia TaxID=5886 RepID=A0A8S1LHF3_PARPR|nr:unnamed protein product [Paramecium primaurelia]
MINIYIIFIFIIFSLNGEFQRQYNNQEPIYLLLIQNLSKQKIYRNCFHFLYNIRISRNQIQMEIDQEIYQMIYLNQKVWKHQIQPIICFKLVKSQKTFPQLNHLEIALKSKEEEEIIIENFPQLWMLNQQAIKIEDHFEQQSDMQSERSVLGLEITLQQEDLELMALLHDSIKELRKADRESKNKFYQFLRTLSKLPNTIYMKSVFNCLQDTSDKKLEQIIIKLHDQHQQIFANMSNIRIINKYNQQIKNNQKQNNGNQNKIREQNKDLGKSIKNCNLIQVKLNKKINLIQNYQLNLEKVNRYNQIQLKRIVIMRQRLNFKILIISSQLIQQNNNNNDKEFALNLIKPQQCQYAYIQNKINQQHLSSINGQALTLKQFKDLILEIYESKLKLDQRYSDSHLPRETTEQHKYALLNQKYGLKSLILEWVSYIINALKDMEMKKMMLQCLVKSQEMNVMKNLDSFKIKLRIQFWNY